MGALFASSNDGADALEQIAVIAEHYGLTIGQILEWGPSGRRSALEDDRRAARREGSAERQEEIDQLREALSEAREQLSKSEAHVTRLQFHASTLKERVEAQRDELKSLRASSRNSDTELLGEILIAADQGNPWPVLYRAAREVRG